MNYSQQSKHQGFTIVELLVVIVVIGILAAISIVSYNAVQNRALRSAQQTTLAQVSKQLEAFKLTVSTNEQYPSSLALLGLSPNNNFTLNYSYNILANSYCLIADGGAITYYITSTMQQTKEGSCVSMDGLLGWWPMNGSVADMSGYGTTGTLSGPILATGQNGEPSSSYLLSGATTQSINTNGRYAADRFTVSIWINYDGTGPNASASIISNTRDCCTTNSGFQIDFVRTDPNPLRARLWAGGTSAASTIQGGGLTIGQWSHVVMTYDGTTVRLYQNGAQVSSFAITIANLGTPLYNVSIGKMGQLVSGYSVGGRLDDARIYNRALSAADVQLLYINGAQ